MQMLQARLEIPSIPLALFFRTDGSIVIAAAPGMKAVIDQHEEVSGIFDAEGFTLKEKGVDEGQDYQYNVPYPLQEMPVLRAWLTQQNLPLPQ